MKCRKCGAEVSEGAKFCEMCGARVEAEVNETPVATEEVVAPAVEETVETAAAVETSFAAETPSFSPIPSEPVKKKKSAGAKIAAALVAVLAVVGVVVGLAFASKGVGNFFRKTFLSPEKYLAYVLNDNFGESIDESLNVYDQYVKNARNIDNVNSNVKFEVALGDELSNYISEYAGYYSSDAEMFTWIKKATIEYGVNSFKGESELRAKIGANGVDLISAALVASEEGDIYISVPELCTKTVHIKVDPEELKEVLDVKDMVNSIYKELPTKPELQNISKKYLKAVFDNIKGVKKSSDEITVDDITAKATVLTMELDDVILTNIEIDVLEEFLDDEEFEKIWMRVYEAYEEVVKDTGDVIPDKAESYDEIKKSAKEALEDAKERLDLYKKGELENEVQATITFYVDNKGGLSGCSITDGEFEASYIQPANGGRFGVEAVMKGFGPYSEFDNLTIVGTGKESDSVLTANMTAKVDGEKLFDVVINNYDKSINKKGEGSFDVAITNVNFGEDSASDLEILNEIIGDTNVGFYYKGTVSKNGGEATMSLGNGEKDLFSLTVATEIKDGSEASIGDKSSAVNLDMDNGEGFGDVLNAVDEKTVAENLRKAGAGDELADMLESTLEYFKSMAAYY